jgi:hypothetical protein
MAADTSGSWHTNSIPSGRNRSAWVTPLLHKLRHNPDHWLIHTLEDFLTTNPADAAVKGGVIYFQNDRDHLNYTDVAARNAPVGSGSMESTCSPFRNRLKRCGQFWSPSDLAHMLAVDGAFKNSTVNFLWN